MATVTFQLATVPSNLNLTPAAPPDPDATSTPVNSNQAQGAPAPLDTVTLAAQAAQGQGSAQNQTDSQSQGSPAFVAAATLFANAISTYSHNGNAAPSTQGASPPQQQLVPFSLEANQATIASTSAQNTTSAATQSNFSQTQMHELQQLDETLRQMGVDPQNISIFNQMAMLFFSSNPAGLQQFIQQFQQTAEQLLQQGVAGSNLSQNPDQAQPESSSGSVPRQESAAALVSNSATAQPESQSGTAIRPLTVQFQELQFAVAAVGGHVQLPANNSQPDTQGESLNVTF